MQEIGTLTLAFMLMVRVAAASYLAIGVLGMLWFNDYYFAGKYLLGAATKAIPLICLFVGVVSPERCFLSKPYSFAYQVLLAIGMVCVAISMGYDLSLPNGPDYAAFRMQLFLLGILLIFVLRAIFVCNLGVTRTTKSKMPGSQ
jgi:hypothetical protein